MSSLRKLYNIVECYIRGLESLGKKKDTFGDLLVSLILGKLPTAVVRNFTRNYTLDECDIDELCTPSFAGFSLLGDRR